MTLLQASARNRPDFIVGDRLRKARELSGLEKNAFAARIGIHRDTVAKYESSETPPRLPVLKAWSDATGVDIDWILAGETPKTQPLDYTATVTHIIRRRPPTRTDATGPRNRRRAS